jgi:hypothetical protein
VSILALWLPFYCRPSHIGIIDFSLVYGFVSGAFVCLLISYVVMAGDLAMLGQRFRTFQVVISVRSVIYSPGANRLISRQQVTDDSELKLFASASILVGTVLLTVSIYFLSRPQKTWKV